MLADCLTPASSPRTCRRMGRKQINHEQTPARFSEGTLSRIDATLAAREKRSDFIRVAVERELARREQKSADQSAAKDHESARQA